MFCESCGAQVNEEAKFCTDCGEFLLIDPKGNSPQTHLETEALIRITRTSQYANKFRAYSIRIDGVKTGKIKDGETFTHAVAPGKHIVQARIDWCRTKPIQVAVESGGQVNLEVGCYTAGWRLVFALFDVIWPGRWLFLANA